MVSAGDLDDAASDELSEAIERVLDGEDVEEPVTLAAVRQTLKRSAQARSLPLRRIEGDQRDALIAELDSLIDVHGADADAERFTQPFAGPDLTRVIEHAIERAEGVAQATLGYLQGMIEGGLLAELIAEGEVAEEDEQGIRASLEALIERHGDKAFAEDFIGSS